MKNKNISHTVGTVPKFNRRNFVETGNIAIVTHINILAVPDLPIGSID